jgi:hypothetical protein
VSIQYIFLSLIVSNTRDEVSATLGYSDPVKIGHGRFDEELQKSIVAVTF